MNMKQVATILLATAAVLLASCSEDSDGILSRQQTSMASYLGSTHSPRLIPESELDSSLEENPQYYSVFGNSAYRYITNMYDEGRDQRTEVAWGDSVELVYTAYVFDFKTVKAENIYATNDSDSLEALRQAGLDTSYEWTTEPLAVTVGSTNIIKGIESSLVGCREGDIVEVYMTFTMAYDDMTIGTVPYQSPVAWYFTIIKVNERN